MQKSMFTVFWVLDVGMAVMKTGENIAVVVKPYKPDTMYAQGDFVHTTSNDCFVAKINTCTAPSQQNKDWLWVGKALDL